MKNTRDTLFVATAALAAGLLAALCSGCDGSGGEGDVVGDAGRADAEGSARADAGRSDVVRLDSQAASDARATSCQVPEPKFSLSGLVSTTPRKGYRIMEGENVPCLAQLAGSPQPTNCDDPVDGFASSATEPWFCVVSQKVGDTYYLVSPILQYQDKSVVMGALGPGGVAVCSPRGKFLGWSCS